MTIETYRWVCALDLDTGSAYLATCDSHNPVESPGPSCRNRDSVYTSRSGEVCFYYTSRIAAFTVPSISALRFCTSCQWRINLDTRCKCRMILSALRCLYSPRVLGSLVPRFVAWKPQGSIENFVGRTTMPTILSTGRHDSV